MEQQRLLSSPLGVTDAKEYNAEFTEKLIDEIEANGEKRKRRRSLQWLTCCLIGVVILGLGFTCGELLAQRRRSNNDGPDIKTSNANDRCRSPSVRREWRSLSTSEKDRYIDAVLCLRTKPSRLDMSHSLYDDFPYVHNQYDKEIHFAASFLPWHRYFIQTYHRALVDECQYAGELPYWDWTLDWQDLFGAPVWDIEHGFSANGNSSTDASSLFPRSHCVSEGRFANIQVMYAGNVTETHCLTRDFGSGEPLDSLVQKVQPSAVEELMAEGDYYRFLIHLEAKAHLSIPKAIMGDFSLFTAPNDPIFFLHHAQLDRLWTRWEQHDLENRRNAYSGSYVAKSMRNANVNDVLSIGGLAPDLEVRDMLDTTSSLLCYKY